MFSTVQADEALPDSVNMKPGSKIAHDNNSVSGFLFQELSFLCEAEIFISSASVWF